MIRSKDINIISEAFKYCHKNKNAKGYTICAILAKGKKIISIAKNDYRKTHARTPQIRHYVIPGHAEIKCISRYIVKNRSITSDMTLYVVGITQGKDGNPVISSKPCESCERFIKTCGIPRVVYCENVTEFLIKEMNNV